MTVQAAALRRRVGPLAAVATGIVAIATKELRGRMRGRRAFILLTFYLLVLGGFGWMLQLLSEEAASFQFGGALQASATIGRAVFTGLLFFQTLLVLFLAPAYTAGAISLEREKQTLDMLAATPISSVSIVLGKLLSALTFVFLLVLASIPLSALVFTFGGVAPDDLVRGYVVMLVSAIGLGTIGLFASSLVRRTQAATVLTYFLVLALTLGTGFIFLFWSVMSGWNFGNNGGFVPRDESFIDSLERRPPAALMWFNPFVAQADVLCGTESGFGGTCGIISTINDQPAGGFVNPGDPNPAFGVRRDSYWPTSVAAWLVLSLILLVLSVQLVTPTRRWRLRLPRPRRRPSGSPA